MVSIKQADLDALNHRIEQADEKSAIDEEQKKLTTGK